MGTKGADMECISVRELLRDFQEAHASLIKTLAVLQGPGKKAATTCMYEVCRTSYPAQLDMRGIKKWELLQGGLKLFADAQALEIRLPSQSLLVNVPPDHFFYEGRDVWDALPGGRWIQTIGEPFLDAGQEQIQFKKPCTIRVYGEKHFYLTDKAGREYQCERR